MYGQIIRQFDFTLGNLDAVLTKAEQYAVTRGFAAENFLSARLSPDMLPFVKQIQIACDGCKIAAARVADVAPPTFADTESTFAQLHERIAKTRAFVQGLDLDSPAAKDGSRRVSAGYPPDKTMTLHDYIVMRQIANFYFHVVTAYDLLRAGGVPVGKGDYLGDLPMQ